MGHAIKVILVVAPTARDAQKWVLGYKTHADGTCAAVCMAVDGSGYNMADVGVPLLTPAAKKYNLAASNVGLLHTSVTTEAAYFKLLESLEAQGVLHLLWCIMDDAPSTNWPPSAAALHAIYGMSRGTHIRGYAAGLSMSWRVP